jgi:hypothetical protein
MSKSKARRIEQSAAWAVMRADRRFLWLWLAVASVLTVAANIGYMWLVLSPDHTLPLWMAVSWAVAPPTLLMLSIHGLSTLGRMLGDDRRDRWLTAITWGIAIGAFGWSAVGVYGFTAAALGTATAVAFPPQLAIVAPLAIDLTVIGATRALVLTTPIAAQMRKEVEADAAPAPAPRAAPPTPRNAAPATPTAASTPVRDAALAVRADDAAPTSAQVVTVQHASDAASDASTAIVLAAPASPAPAASPSASDVGGDEAPEVAARHMQRAAELIGGKVVSIPIEDAAVVLAYLEAGLSNRRVQAVTGIDARTVAKIRNAEAAPVLTAVG